MKKNKINMRIVIDICAFIILVSCFLIEFFKVVHFEIENRVNVDLIIILLPTIITIVSISLSLTKEKIYGVTINEFIKLRKKSTYCFLHMVIIMSLCIAFYSALFLFEKSFTILVLDAIAFLYSVIFAVQEIPVLVQNKRALRKIIMFSYENRRKAEIFLEQRDENTLYRVMQNMVLVEGIKVAYNSLKSNSSDEESKMHNSNLFDNLLTFQNKYYFDASEDLKFLSDNLSGEYKNIDILSAINRGYWNIEDLLSNDVSINFFNDFKEDKTYHLTRSIFALHSICSRLELQEKEKKKIEGIISNILLASISDGKVDKKYMSFALTMSIISLKDGDVWFIKYLRDNNLYPSILFSFDKCLLGLFITIFISHIINYNLIPVEKINMINAFLNEPTEGLNSDGSTTWNCLFFSMLEFSNSISLANSLLKLLETYNFVPEVYYYFMKEMVFCDSSTDFSRSVIIDAWLEMILFGESFGIKKDDVVSVINSLNGDNKEAFINTLTDRWIEDDHLRIDYKIKFLSSFSNHKIEAKENFYNKPIIDFLVKYKNDYYMEEHINKIKNDAADSKEIVCRIKKSLNNYKEKCIFCDKNLDFSKNKKICFSWKLEKGDLYMLLDAYIKQFPDSVDYFFRKIIESEVKKNVFLDYKLTQTQINEIKKFSPDGRSSLNGIIYNTSDELNEISMGLQSSECKMIPSNFFFKKEAIRVNVEIDEELSEVNYLTNDELDYLIDNEYQDINGLYRYSEFTNDTKRSFLVTREDLRTLLYNQTRYVIIYLKYEIAVDSDKCLWYKHEKSK